MNHPQAALALAITAFCATAPAWAELTATPLRGDTRLVEYQYDADNTYLILTKPRSVTHLDFGESFTVMATGDSANFEITITRIKMIPATTVPFLMGGLADVPLG